MNPVDDDWQDDDGFVENLVAELHAGLHDGRTLDDEDDAEVALERHLAGEDEPVDDDEDDDA